MTSTAIAASRMHLRYASVADRLGFAVRPLPDRNVAGTHHVIAVTTRPHAHESLKEARVTNVDGIYS
jgi:hypothetical protein